MRIASLTRAPAAILTAGPVQKSVPRYISHDRRYSRADTLGHPPSDTLGPILADSSTSAVGSIKTGGKIVGPVLPGLPGWVNSLEFVFWN